MRVKRSTYRYPGGTVTYPDGSKGGEAGIQQSVVFGDSPRLHLIRRRKASGRWSVFTAILTVGRVAIEYRRRA